MSTPWVSGNHYSTVNCTVQHVPLALALGVFPWLCLKDQCLTHCRVCSFLTTWIRAQQTDYKVQESTRIFCTAHTCKYTTCACTQPIHVCMYMHACVHLPTSTHASTNTHTCKHKHTHMHAHMHTHTHTRYQHFCCKTCQDGGLKSKRWLRYNHLHCKRGTLTLR